MPAQTDYQNIPLEAFIALPDTLDIILPFSPEIAILLKDYPYVRIGKNAGNYVVAYLHRNDLLSFVTALSTSQINIIPMVLSLMGRQELDASGITQTQHQPYLDLKGQGVLIGFVDTGIDYTNPAFIYEDGTSKVKYIWDQSILGTPPAGYFYGAEYSHEQINQALQSQVPFDLIPSRDTQGHGTFLASLAAGRNQGNLVGAAPDADLIIVKLQKTKKYYTDYYLVPPEQNNVFSSSDVMLGIQYILDKALELRMPVSICLGLGTNLGSHEGLDPLESFITSICYKNDVALSVAAGDESNKRHHTSGIIQKKGDTQTIEIVGNGNGSIFLSLWSLASDKMSVSVTSPIGELVGRIPFRSGTYNDTKLTLEKAHVIIQYIFPADGTGSQLTIIRITDPTPGIWQVHVYGDIIVDGSFHAWLPVTGLLDPGIEFLTPDPSCTISSPATAIGTISCGAYDSSNNSLYASSSWGPTRLPMISPVLVAPGVNVNGLYPTGAGTMSGTSVSAAITAGASALLLQWGCVNGNQPIMNSFLVRSYLIKGCVRDLAITYPNIQWGYGRLNLFNTFNLMKNI